MAIQLSAKNVVGRDRLIKRIWRRLERESILFTAERRIGKTTVMQKMREEAPEGVVAVYMDLEKVDTPKRFVEVLLQEVHELLPKESGVVSLFRGLLEALEGVEVGGVIKVPEGGKDRWQPALEKTFACICEHHKGSMVLFMFDELPYMLQKIAIREGDEAGTNSALAILDSLRAIRAEQDNLRMIYTGSVGIHHVIHTLRGGLYASQPLNNMSTVEIGPLDLSDAKALAGRLLKEERINCDDASAVIDEIVQQADRVPFYIERVVFQLAEMEKSIFPEDVRRQVRRNLTDDHDPWEMGHFRARIPIYYPGQIDLGDRKTVLKEELVFDLLNIMAIAEDPLSIDEIEAEVKAVRPLENRPLIIELLGCLYQDHYLICNEQKHYAFRFPLVKQWWKLAQGLAS